MHNTSHCTVQSIVYLTVSVLHSAGLATSERRSLPNQHIISSLIGTLQSLLNTAHWKLNINPLWGKYFVSNQKFPHIFWKRPRWLGQLGQLGLLGWLGQLGSTNKQTVRRVIWVNIFLIKKKKCNLQFLILPTFCPYHGLFKSFSVYQNWSYIYLNWQEAEVQALIQHIYHIYCQDYFGIIKYNAFNLFSNFCYCFLNLVFKINLEPALVASKSCFSYTPIFFAVFLDFFQNGTSQRAEVYCVVISALKMLH